MVTDHGSDSAPPTSTMRSNSRTTRTIRGKAAIVGVGESTYYKRGQSPHQEFVLVLQAILAACASAGIDPHTIDGFASYSDDRNHAQRLASALGIEELRHSSMVWGGGGGGVAGAVAQASSAVAAGMADRVVVFRGLAQGQFGRFGQAAPGRTTISGNGAHTVPYGVLSPAQNYAMRYQRFIHDNGGAGMAAQRAVALASYHHAQNNPRAVMAGRPLDEEGYESSRWIVEPWRLFDCCQENDGAAALIIAPGEHAPDLCARPAYVLAAGQSMPHRWESAVHNSPMYTGAGAVRLAPRLWETAGLAPGEVDVVQSYENFTGGVVMSMVDHGFCEPEAVDEVLTLENLIAPNGRIPLNTSGGNLAECYMHGLGLVAEGVRQIRGESSNQVPDADTCLVASGPMVFTSSLVLGSPNTI